jgi:hypothetical protein
MSEKITSGKWMVMQDHYNEGRFAIYCGILETGLASDLSIEIAERVVECVNAMSDVASPQKLRETWDVVKDLHLDEYHQLELKYKALEQELNEIRIEKTR